MTAAIPDDILVAAENALDQLLCNCKEAGDVRHDSIMDIARALQAERNRATEAYAFVDWVETWVSNPVGAYSVHALDGLFGMTRDRIAAIRNQPPAGE